MALPLVGSITDYPLRAPLMACAFAGAATILSIVMRERVGQIRLAVGG